VRPDGFVVLAVSTVFSFWTNFTVTVSQECLANQLLLDLSFVSKWNSVLTLPMDTVNSPGGQRKTFLKADVGGLVSDLAERSRKKNAHSALANRNTLRTAIDRWWQRTTNCAMACPDTHMSRPLSLEMMTLRLLSVGYARNSTTGRESHHLGS
jgi:hypothetical protein